MEGLKIQISEFAEAELLKECLFHAEHYSEKYAERFRIEFYKQVTTIGPNPMVYPECRFLPTQKKVYRNIIWGNYLIIYRIKANVVRVLTLFHTKQHPSKIKRIRSR
ncbi:MAG: type II toxin-antitoxin system RelE/ParE family toxin [Chitinophagales bacterium]|nr:type II toxin-antitoxin system RelE/ParE family toxin [Chitinophagales bacterium]